MAFRPSGRTDPNDATTASFVRLDLKTLHYPETMPKKMAEKNETVLEILAETMQSVSDNWHKGDKIILQRWDAKVKEERAPDVELGTEAAEKIKNIGTNRHRTCLQFNIANGQCSPSARKWVHWVATNFTYPPMAYNFADVYVDGSALNLAAKQAYADVIVGHYAERFGDRIAGKSHLCRWTCR